MSAHEDFIWTGNWPDAMQFMDRVGYSVQFLGRPAILICPEGLHVENQFTEEFDHAAVGDKVRWYPSTRSFQVVHIA